MSESEHSDPREGVDIEVDDVSQKAVDDLLERRGRPNNAEIEVSDT